MAAVGAAAPQDEKWYFTKEQLLDTPSRKCGIDADKELCYRQQAANFIQDMGQKLQVSQLCINTAIVYMHRFYMFHSFTHFPWNTIAAASFFLAAKVEEQPRKLEHVIRVANHCLHRDQAPAFDAKSEQYTAQSQDLVFNENVLLQTLGFDVAIDHPHTHVVRCCHLVKASKDLAQTSYFMASNRYRPKQDKCWLFSLNVDCFSLHLTTMCLQYKPTVVACFCIHLACKWSNWQIPKSNEGKDWFYYVDKNVTLDLLEQLTAEFLKIYDKCPSRLKRKISSISTVTPGHSSQTPSIDQLHAASCSSPFDADAKKGHSYDGKDMSTFHPKLHYEAKPALLATPEDPHKKLQRTHDPFAQQPPTQPQRTDYREYRERKEKERLERAQHHAKAAAAVPGGKHMATVPTAKLPHGTHHRPTLDPNKMKMQLPHHRDPAVLPHKETVMTNGRDAVVKDGLKRDYVTQPKFEDPVKMDGNTQRYDSNRPKTVDPKLQVKQQAQHELNRHRRDCTDPKFQKRSDVQSAPLVSANLSEVSKKPVSVSTQDKPNTFVSKPINSTSQRHKSPFQDVPKSVPSTATQSVKLESQTLKLETQSVTRNGNHTSASLPNLLQDFDSQLEPVLLSKKPASLFSPEKTPPQKITWNVSDKRTDMQSATQPTVPRVISPFNSPPPKSAQPTPKRTRSSSSSEPELRPVVKKLDQISGFENIIRDSKMGIKLPKVPDIIQPICDRAPSAETSISKELKPPDIIKPFNVSTENIALSQPLVNGIETDPAMISTLLKEAVTPSTNHLPNEKIQEPPIPAPADNVPSDKQKSEHHHKSEKKKKKEKHKHKDKDKTREERKKKHKDKDRHKSKTEKTEQEIEAPLKITILKGKMQPPTDSVVPVNTGLKVKISKDRLKKDTLTETPLPSVSPSSLKIKISKDQIQYNSVVDNTPGNGRKRDKDKMSSMLGLGAPPPKIVKTNSYSRPPDVRPNGRNSYTNKVTQLGEGEASQLRLAESKYHSKGASKAS